jgi:hypothetical protein
MQVHSVLHTVGRDSVSLLILLAKVVTSRLFLFTKFIVTNLLACMSARSFVNSLSALLITMVFAVA